MIRACASTVAFFPLVGLNELVGRALNMIVAGDETPATQQTSFVDTTKGSRIDDTRLRDGAPMIYS